MVIIYHKRSTGKYWGCLGDHCEGRWQSEFIISVKFCLKLSSTGHWAPSKLKERGLGREPEYQDGGDWECTVTNTSSWAGASFSHFTWRLQLRFSKYLVKWENAWDLKSWSERKSSPGRRGNIAAIAVGVCVARGWSGLGRAGNTRDALQAGQAGQALVAAGEDVLLVLGEFPHQVVHHPHTHPHHDQDQEDKDDDHVGRTEVKRDGRTLHHADLLVPAAFTVPDSVTNWRSKQLKYHSEQHFFSKILTLT